MQRTPRTRREVREAHQFVKISLKFAKSAFARELQADKCPLARNIDDFEILGIVGRGGYGTVYKVRHPEYGITALKVQELRFAQEAEAAIKEKRFLHALDNKYILKGIAHIRDEDNLYLITAFAPYGSYKRIMKTKEESTVRVFYAQMGCGLQYLHSVQIVHGDFHPGNILVFRGGHLKLADFGLAQASVDGLVHFAGYNRYLAPEMLLGVSHGSAADWWSLGTMMYEQLVGRHPYVPPGADARFLDDELRDLMMRPLEALEDELDVSPKAEELIRRTMEMDPTKRVGRDLASIQAFLDHPWFNGIDYGLLLNEENSIPQFGYIKLDEAKLQPTPFKTIDDLKIGYW